MAYIRKLCKRIAEAYQPEKIILFGSHAYGKPTPESDVDLLIVMDYEWIEKAEGDWDEAQRAYRARKRPNYDAAGFHAQQCVEKYLKAKLNEASLIFDKTHDLAELLKQASTVEPSWSRMAPWRAHAERR
ncbi:MAG: HEPN domain-containing protein [Blastocatellia bacterium]